MNEQTRNHNAPAVNRLWQFSIRKLMIAVGIVAVGVWLYMSTGTVVTQHTIAVDFMGAREVDYATAHKQFMSMLTDSQTRLISEPGWAKKWGGSIPTSPSIFHGSISDSLPIQSDWIRIARNGSENFIRVSSSPLGFSVDVWVYRRTMMHQDTDRESALSAELIPEFAAWWEQWLAENGSKDSGGQN